MAEDYQWQRHARSTAKSDSLRFHIVPFNEGFCIKTVFYSTIKSSSTFSFCSWLKLYDKALFVKDCAHTAFPCLVVWSDETIMKLTYIVTMTNQIQTALGTQETSSLIFSHVSSAFLRPVLRLQYTVGNYHHMLATFSGFIL